MLKALETRFCLVVYRETVPGYQESLLVVLSYEYDTRVLYFGVYSDNINVATPLMTEYTSILGTSSTFLAAVPAPSLQLSLPSNSPSVRTIFWEVSMLPVRPMSQ